MLDIKFIRENKEKIAEAARNKNIKLDVNLLLSVDDKRRALIQQIDELRSRRNVLAEQNKGGKPSTEQIEAGKKIKEEISAREADLSQTEGEYSDLMVQVPNIPSADTPIGHDEKDNVEVYHWGEPTKFDFAPKSHIELGEALDILDFDRGVKVAGYRGYFVKNDGVFLQLALMLFALDKLASRGFKPMIPPTLVKEFALFGSGYFAGRKFNPQIDEIYKIENSEKEADGKTNAESRFLIGTAEPSLLAYYSGEVLNEKDLPLKMCGFSQCYRSEIGSYGKDTKGIYRVHEFMKVEQVCICRNDVAEAEKMHLEMSEISQELHQELGLPFRKIQICTGDMSAGKYKMFDLEAWIPSRNGYGETGSASNFLDWQSRRLDIKFKNAAGEKNYAFLLNNTAIPSPRIMIAVMENYQQADGSIVIPEVLRKYIPGGLSVIKK